MEGNASSDDLNNLASQISTAFRQRAKGQTQKYQFIVLQLRCGTDAVLGRLYSALKRCTGDIAKDSYLCEEFAPIALGVRFRPLPTADVAAVTAAQEAIGMSSGAPASAAILSVRTADTFFSFAVDVVASSPGLLPTVARALVRGLSVAQAEADAYAGLRIQRDAADAAQKGLQPSTSLNADVADTLSSLLTSYTRSVYTTLATLVRIVPTGTGIIAAALQDAAPSSRAPLAAHVAHVRHVLTLAGRRYLPAIRDRLVASLVDRMVEVDSSIALDLLPEEVEETGDDNDAPLLVAASPNSSTNDSTSAVEEVAATVASAKRLDHLCLYMFRFVHGYMCDCKGKGQTQGSARKQSVMSEVSESGGEAPGRPVDQQEQVRSDGQPGDSEYDTQYDTDYPASATAALPAYSPQYGVRSNIDSVLDSDYGSECSTVQAIQHAMVLSARQGGTIGRPPKTSGLASEYASEVDTDAKSHTSASAIPVPPAARSASGRADREHVFALMLGVFERSVLLTHRSKFVQFLLFYACSMGAEFVDRFVGRLIAQVRAADKPALTRMTCASYLGSFLGRSAFVSDATLRSALFYMLEWAHGYVDLHAAHALYHDKASGYEAPVGRLDESGVASASEVDAGVETDAGKSSFAGRESIGGPRARMETLTLPPSSLEMDPSLPPLPPVDVFRSVVQAACYVLVFQADAQRQRVGGLQLLRSLQWGTLIACPLDPLAHTAEHVAKEFIRAAYALKLATVAELQACSAYDKLRKLQEEDDEEEDDTSTADDTGTDYSSSDAGQGAPDAQKGEHGNAKSGEGAEPEDAAAEPAVPALLETFFPFDPFLLRKSSRYISGLYRGWSTSRLPIVLAESDGYDTGLTGAAAVGGTGTGRAGGGGYASAGGASRRSVREQRAMPASSGPDSDAGGHVSASSGHRGRGALGDARAGKPGATEEDMEEDEEPNEDEDDDAALAEPSADIPSPALGAALGGMSTSDGAAGAGAGGSSGGGILSRMRAGFQLGPPVALAPGLAAAVAGADDTQALLAGLDIDVGVDEDDEDEDEDGGAEGDKEEQQRKGGTDARRSPSEASSASEPQLLKNQRTSSVASHSAPGHVLGGSKQGSSAYRRRLDSHASSRSGKGAGGINSAGSSPALGPVASSSMSRIRGMSLSTGAGGGVGEAVLKRTKQSLTSKSGVGRHMQARSAIDGAHLLQGAVDVAESPSVNALKSRMRGLSVDETAYYASLAGVNAAAQQQQGDGASIAAQRHAEFLGSLLEEQEQQGEREEEEGSPSSSVMSTGRAAGGDGTGRRTPSLRKASSPILLANTAQGAGPRAAMPAISLALAAPLSLKRRRASSASSSLSGDELTPAGFSHATNVPSVLPAIPQPAAAPARTGAAATHRPRLSIGLSPFDPQSSLPPDLQAAAQAYDHASASVPLHEESPTASGVGATGNGPRRSARSVRKVAKLQGDDTATASSARVSTAGGRRRGGAGMKTLLRAASGGGLGSTVAAGRSLALPTSASAPTLMSGAHDEDSPPVSAASSSGQAVGPGQAVPAWDLFQSMMMAAADELTPNRAAARDARDAASTADSEIEGGFVPTRAGAAASTAANVTAGGSTSSTPRAASGRNAGAGKKTR